MRKDLLENIREWSAKRKNCDCWSRIYVVSRTVARLFDASGAYRCSDYKHRLYYGLVISEHTSRSTGILIRKFTHAHSSQKYLRICKILS